MFATTATRTHGSWPGLVLLERVDEQERSHADDERQRRGIDRVSDRVANIGQPHILAADVVEKHLRHGEEPCERGGDEEGGPVLAQR